MRAYEGNYFFNKYDLLLLSIEFNALNRSYNRDYKRTYFWATI